MSGHVGDLSPKQQEALAKFRENIQDILPLLPDKDDYFMLKWLRARCFDLQKSEAMIRKHVAFRKRMDADHILEWKAPEVIQKYLAGGYCGIDLEGSPIWYEMVGPLDAKGILYSASKQDLLKKKFQESEIIRLMGDELTKKFGKKIETVTLICDFEGLGLKHLWKPGVDAYGELICMVEDNFPESLKRIFIVRAPKLFPVAYNLVKHFLSEDTRKKIIILGADWKDVLRKHIDPSELPVEYGGTLTDPDGDPKCKSKLNYGGDVPKKYYLQDQLKQQYDHTLAVNRGSTQQVEYEILFPGCVLRWQFMSDGADIGFGVFLKTKSGEHQHASEMKEVYGTQRYNAHMVPEDGSITCEEAGIYVLRFDNTYSYLYSKKISYSVEVLLPDKKQEERFEELEKQTSGLAIHCE